MQVGIVGLSLSGKTSTFRAVTGVEAQLSHALGERREASQAVVAVPDERLDKLEAAFQSKKRTAATVELVDHPGIRPGAQDREAAFDPAVRGVEALAAVVRAFGDPAVPHPLDRVDAAADLTTFVEELILTDLEVVERRLERIEKDRSRGRASSEAEYKTLKRCQSALVEERSLRELEWTRDEDAVLKAFGLVSAKPLLVVVNVDEDGISSATEAALRAEAEKRGLPLGFLAARLELELADLAPEERETFRADYGLEASARDVLVREAYEGLDVITFYTVGEKEARAWTLRRGATAVEAAGKIHTDMARGFVRAEVIHYDELMEHGTVAAARDKGFYRLEGRDYVVKDGDTLVIRFNK
jgi:GTP-binding protein YchF